MNKKVLALAAASAAFSPAQKDTTIRTESRLVVVDAVVMDRKGAYVGDLAQKDFKIWEDGKEQIITTFSREAGSQKHNIILFFDDSTITPAQQHFARAAASRFVETSAGPDRPVAVVEFAGDLRVPQNFTEDKDRLRKALNQTGLAAGNAAMTSPTATASAARNDPTAAFNNYSTRSLISGIRDLTDRLAGVPGRKSLIFFSEGFRTRPEDVRAITDACNRANIALYPVDVRGGASAGRANGTGVDADFNSSDGVTSARPQDRRRGGANSGQLEGISDAGVQNPDDTLDTLARNTGGFLLSRLGDLIAGMARIGNEQNEYYVLGYVPAKSPEPGSCHSIKVKVDRGGANVRARPEYCEAKTLDVLAGTATQRDLESRLTGSTVSTVQASMQAPFFYTGENTARVDLALDIPGTVVKFAKDKGRFAGVLNVVGIAYSGDGAVAARFSDNVKVIFDDKKEVEEFAARTYHYEKQFPISAGAFNLKVAFSAGEGFGRIEAPLSIESWDSRRFWLSGLALSTSARPASGGLSLGPDLFGDKVPLVINGVQLLPAGTNRLRKSEKVYVYAEVYDPALAPADVQVQLLDGTSGKLVKDLGVAKLNPASANELKAIPVGLTIPLDDLAPGSYAAKVTAQEPGESQISRRIAFELLP